MSIQDSIRKDVFIVLVLLALVTVLALAPTPSAQELKPLQQTESVTAKATIKEIDRANRLITLKGPKGNLVVVEAAEGMKRFDKLKVGDEVTATYTESLAVRVRKAGEPEPERRKELVKTRDTGPGGTATVQQTITVTVEEIDRSAPSITVKGPEGNVYDFRVREPRRLENLQVGDKVDITYTRALLLSVDPVVR